MANIYSQNKVAFRDYEILEKFEAGIILKGFEVKAIRKGKMNLKSSYVTLHDNQLVLTGASISPYQAANTPKDYDPTRSRVLLLNANEKRKLIGQIRPSRDKKKKGKSQTNLSLIPLKVYDKNNLIKIELGLARGLKRYDKREKLKKKESQRNIRKALMK